MIVVVMGVTASGKTTVGRLLAERLGWIFYDADAFHPPANVEKMRRGSPLTDADREPWLAAVRSRMDEIAAVGEDAVIACSALRQSYRDLLAGTRTPVRFVYLKADRAVLEERLRRRKAHFMPAGLLASQLATLEEPREAITVDAARLPEELVEQIVRELAGRRSAPLGTRGFDPERC